MLQFFFNLNFKNKIYQASPIQAWHKASRDKVLNMYAIALATAEERIEGYHTFILLTLLFPLYLAANKRTLNFILAKNQHHSLNSDFLQHMKSVFNPEIFIESGTYKGETTDLASLIFTNVYSIELDNDLYNNAIKRFQNRKNVKILPGDSKSILKQILPSCENKKVFIYLDAHWSGPGTAKGEETTPIIQELISIKNSNVKDAIIAIDDMRFFQPKNVVEEYTKHNNDPTAIGFPSISEISTIIKSINSDYKIVLYGDILIAFIENNEIEIAPILDAMLICRKYNLNEENEEIINAEKIIATAQPNEMNAIHGLMRVYGPDEFRLHYLYWYALVLIKEKNAHAAVDVLNKLISLGCVHNRFVKHLNETKRTYGI